MRNEDAMSTTPKLTFMFIVADIGLVIYSDTTNSDEGNYGNYECRITNEKSPFILRMSPGLNKTQISGLS